MLIQTPRFVLRDFRESDRPAFVAYQMDPRYRRLYGFDADPRRAHALFDRFRSWQQEEPRRDFQVGIFAAATGRLCGSCGLRRSEAPAGAAVLGLELTPDDWGHYRLAINVAGAMIEHGFRVLGADLIIGRAASGNRRVERLARRFGATIVARRDGPPWMAARGWREVDWALYRNAWTGPAKARLALAGTGREPRALADDARDAGAGIRDTKR